MLLKRAPHTSLLAQLILQQPLSKPVNFETIKSTTFGKEENNLCISYFLATLAFSRPAT